MGFWVCISYHSCIYLKTHNSVSWFGLTNLANWQELKGECVSYATPTHTITCVLVLNTCMHPHTNRYAHTCTQIRIQIGMRNRVHKKSNCQFLRLVFHHFSPIFTFNCWNGQANTFTCSRTHHVTHMVSKTCDFVCNLMPCRAKELFLWGQSSWDTFSQFFPSRNLRKGVVWTIAPID